MDHFYQVNRSALRMYIISACRINLLTFKGKFLSIEFVKEYSSGRQLNQKSVVPAGH